MKKYPKCKFVSEHRLKRKTFLKLIPGAKTYVCDTCNTVYKSFPLINRSLRI